MNRRIWKYQLQIIDRQIFSMPVGAKLLSVGNQTDDPLFGELQTGSCVCIWALVDTDADLVERTFEIIGTGNPMEDDERFFVGTCIIDPFVWHVFEVIG